MQQLLRAPRFWGARRPLYNRGLNCSLLYAKPGSRGLHFSLLYARVDARIEVPKANSQKGVLQFTYVIQKHYSLKASSFLILSGDLLLRVGPFHAVDCVKSVDFKMFFVYILNLLRVPFWHIYT